MSESNVWGRRVEGKIKQGGKYTHPWCSYPLLQQQPTLLSIAPRCDMSGVLSYSVLTYMVQSLEGGKDRRGHAKVI